MKRSKIHPGRVLHIAQDDTPSVPTYADAMLRARSADEDNRELARVARRLEDLLLVPRARVPSIVLDALYVYATLNKLDLPFSEFTRQRAERDDFMQRFLHWYWREVERKRK